MFYISCHRRRTLGQFHCERAVNREIPLADIEAKIIFPGPRVIINIIVLGGGRFNAFICAGGVYVGVEGPKREISSRRGGGFSLLLLLLLGWAVP